MPKQLNVDLRFNADTSQAKKQIQDLQTSLDKLGSGSAKDLGLDKMNSELAEATNHVNLLKAQLEKAFNSGTPGNVFIMSKNVSSSSSNIQSIKIEDEGEPYEVARYNLQGIPVKSYEKGVQVIVYSNYTTKTVVVE